MGIEFKRRLSDIESAPVSLRKIADGKNIAAPEVDIRQNDRELVAHVKVAGLDKSAIKTSFEGSQLIITAKKKSDRDETRGVVHRVEHIENDFKFQFEIPQGVDKSSIKISYENGVLIVRMAKHPGMSTGRIG